MNATATDKFYLTEILNDLHRHGFVARGKAQTMLHDWSRELRERSRTSFPASRLRNVHTQTCGRWRW